MEKVDYFEPAFLKREDRKWDKGKLKFSLVLPEFHALMAEILTRGEINHPKEPDGTPSWQLVEPVAYQDALERHFNKYKSGEIVDPDPLMPTDHMGNIAVNAMFLWWFNQQKEKNETIGGAEQQLPGVGEGSKKDLQRIDIRHGTVQAKNSQ